MSEVLINSEFWPRYYHVEFSYSIEIYPTVIKRVIDQNSGHTFFTPEALLRVKTLEKPFYLCGIKRYEKSVSLSTPNYFSQILGILKKYKLKGLNTGIWVDDNIFYIDVVSILEEEEKAFQMATEEKQIAVTLVIPNLKDAYVLYRAP